MTKRSVRTHRIDMKKYTLRRKYFLGDQKWSNVNKICACISEILVRSLDLGRNLQNVATLPTTYLCEFCELCTQIFTADASGVECLVLGLFEPIVLISEIISG